MVHHLLITDSFIVFRRSVFFVGRAIVSLDRGKHSSIFTQAVFRARDLAQSIVIYMLVLKKFK